MWNQRKGENAKKWSRKTSGESVLGNSSFKVLSRFLFSLKHCFEALEIMCLVCQHLIFYFQAHMSLKQGLKNITMGAKNICTHYLNIPFISSLFRFKKPSISNNNFNTICSFISFWNLIFPKSKFKS